MNQKRRINGNYRFRHTMALNNNPSWKVRKVVKVGFLKLRVLEVRVIKDGLPDTYILENLERTERYEFTPLNRLKLIEKNPYEPKT